MHINPKLEMFIWELRNCDSVLILNLILIPWRQKLYYPYNMLYTLLNLLMKGTKYLGGKTFIIVVIMMQGMHLDKISTSIIVH